MSLPKFDVSLKFPIFLNFKLLGNLRGNSYTTFVTLNTKFRFIKHCKVPKYHDQREKKGVVDNFV